MAQARASYTLDVNARYFGFSVLQMMENAGRGAADETQKLFGEGKKIAVVCGTGNNGGDGFVAARFLAPKNEVTVFLCGREDEIKSDEARANFSLLGHSGVRLLSIRDSSEARNAFDSYHVILDCLLGAGLSGEPRQPARSIIDAMNGSQARRVSIDVPSGFPSPHAVKSDVVFNLHHQKTEGGLVLSLGVPRSLESLIGPGDVRFLSWRKASSHKGDNGRVLVVGGSRLYAGAPIYCGLAASRIADLVYVSSPPDVLPFIKPHPEFIAQDFSMLDDFLAKADVVACGCGLGTGDESKEILRKVLASKKKKVLDADALTLLDPARLDQSCIVTPHAGEYAALFGVAPTDENIEDNAQRHGCTIVLKGAVDVVCQNRVVFNHTGNEGMTTGGTGDVLAGVIAALACTNDNFEAACAGTFICGLAGDLVRKESGTNFTATDVIARISEAIEWCMRF